MNTEINNILFLSGMIIPIISVFMCSILTFAFYLTHKVPENNKPVQQMLWYYGLVGINWFFVLLFFFMPDLYVYVSSFVAATFLLEFVMMYRFIFTLTATDPDEKFSNGHYLFPILYSIVILFWGVFLPPDVYKHTVQTRGTVPVNGYEAFAMLIYMILVVKLIHNFIYMILSFRRINRFSKIIGNYSADEGRSSIYWLRIFYLLSFLFIPISYACLYHSKESSLTPIVPIATMWIIGFQHMIICYNILLENYTLISIKEEPEEELPESAKKIQKETFEEYIIKEKPFLNPKLRITDLAQELGVNRTYLSSFINRIYGMNFSQYINLCRLKEFNTLRFDSAANKMNKSEMLVAAGFSSYRGYKRALSMDGQEDE